MSDDFGDEVFGVFNRLSADDRALSHGVDEMTGYLNYGPSVSSIVQEFVESSASILYFPAGRYRLAALPDESQGGVYTEFVIPSGRQLWFASGAVLRIDEGVTLRITGSIRAGNCQIFGFDRGQYEWPLRGDPSPPRYGAFTAPLGTVVFDGDEVPLVRPEWWGAYARQDGTDIAGSNFYFDSSDALQAAINAACVTRAGRSSIPIEVSGVYRCSRTLQVVSPNPSALSVCLVMRGTSALGGYPTLARLYDPGLEPPISSVDPDGLVPSRSALYLGPGADFEIEGMEFVGGTGADDAHGCIEIACSARESLPRRGILRRVTLVGGNLFTVRITESGTAPVRRQFVIDGCKLLPTSSASSTYGIWLRASHRVMFRLSNTVTGNSTLPAFANNPLDPSNPLPINRSLDPSATMLLEGGSVLVDACQFQNAIGPRPSQVLPNYDVPDGQEIFLRAPIGPDRSGTHLTCLHCESQGWWFLGRDSHTTDARSVVLINVAQNNSNWGLRDNRIRAEGWGAILADNRNPASPPAIVWNGSEGKLVLLSCRFTFTGVATTAPGAIVDVATAFLITQPPNRMDQTYLYRQGGIAQRPTFVDPAISGGSVTDLSSTVLHLVPIVAQFIRPRWP